MNTSQNPRKRRQFETYIPTSFRMPQFETLDINTIKPSRRNVRIHSKKQIEQIANSILTFGWTAPIVVDERNTIHAGHGRYHAAVLLGLKVVPVVVVTGLSEPEKRAYALADNKIAANAGWDRKGLAMEIAELTPLLPEFKLDIAITGFEAFEIDGLQHDLIDTEAEPIDEVLFPEQQAVTRRGDLWSLGPHRLLCGDARVASSLRKLMRQSTAAMGFTDPPYNLRVSSVQGRGNIKHREFSCASGEMSPTEFTKFLTDSLALAAAHSADGSIHYVCMDWRHLAEMLAAGEQVYGPLKNLIVWVKAHGGMGSFYRSQHELIFVFKKGNASHINNFELGQHGRSRSNVWTYAGVNTFRTGQLDDLAVHPTVLCNPRLPRSVRLS